MTYDGAYWRGKLVKLRPMHADDTHLWLQEEQEDSEAVAFLNAGMTLPKSMHDAEEFAKEFSNFNNQDKHMMFSIDTFAGELVGGINIHSVNRENGTFQTGSRIYSAFRGNGYAFDAKMLVLRYAFHEMRLQKYNIACVASNQGIINHAKRLGCQEEGRIRRNIYMNGQYYDELIFGLTREEFDVLLQTWHTD